MAEASTVAESLRLGYGFRTDERDRVIERLGRLEHRLAGMTPGIELEISVKDRDTRKQRMVLEARVPRWQPLVATSTQLDLDDALAEVREDLLRLLNDQKTRNEPRNNRLKR
jgi:ribosome-associated translation inhibitor RaiA